MALRHEVIARLDAIEKSIDRLRPPTIDGESPPAPDPPPTSVVVERRRPIHVNDTVYVPRLGGSFRVLTVSGDGRVLKVQAGPSRVELRRDELWSLSEQEESARSDRGTKKETSPRQNISSAIPEIDLHGYREADALVTLELFLHHAVVEQTPRIRIIHGKGNGTLRAAVRRELKDHPLVRHIETGPHFAGDDGVTLVELNV